LQFASVIARGDADTSLRHADNISVFNHLTSEEKMKPLYSSLTHRAFCPPFAAGAYRKLNNEASEMF
jgi:hypothetical protein